jgi:hypothetical protein
MSSRKSISVSRTYKPALDDCARAVGLLLQSSFNSQTEKGGPHDLTHNPATAAEGVSQDKKGHDSNVRR